MKRLAVRAAAAVLASIVAAFVGVGSVLGADTTTTVTLASSSTEGSAPAILELSGSVATEATELNRLLGLELATYQTTVTTLTQKGEALEAKLAGTEAQREAALKALAEMTVMRDRLQATNATLSTELTNATLECTLKAGRISELEAARLAAIAAGEEKAASLAAEVKALKEANANLLDQIVALQADAAAYARKSAADGAVIAAQKADIEAKCALISDLKAKVAAAEGALSETLSQNAKLREQANALTLSGGNLSLPVVEPPQAKALEVPKASEPHNGPEGILWFLLGLLGGAVFSGN